MDPYLYNQSFIMAAYAATWVAILGYAWWLARSAARARASYEAASASQEAG